MKSVTAVVEYEGGLTKWHPGPDFCIAFGEGAAQYTLLNGETESGGGNEVEAT